MDAAAYERMAELDSEHWWFVARRAILEELIRREVRPPADADILELGCGTGHNLAMLAKFGTVSATELDPGARALSEKRLGKPIVEAKLPDLSMFPADSFDLVALLDVLEHVEDDRGTLRSIRSRLKPGGKLLVTVPANKWMWSAHDAHHHHHRRYDKTGLGEIARSSGFAIDLLSPFNTLLFPVIAAARVAGKISGRESADDSMPPAPLNAMLRTVFSMEAPIIGRVPLPFGVSLVGIFRRPD